MTIRTPAIRRVRPVIAMRFGVLARPITEQLAVQGYRMPDRALAASVQKDADAITTLYLHGLIPESIASAARGRLMKVIRKEVEKGRGK